MIKVVNTTIVIFFFVAGSYVFNFVLKNNIGYLKGPPFVVCSLLY